MVKIASIVIALASCLTLSAQADTFTFSDAKYTKCPDLEGFMSGKIPVLNWNIKGQVSGPMLNGEMVAEGSLVKFAEDYKSFVFATLWTIQDKAGTALLKAECLGSASVIPVSAKVPQAVWGDQCTITYANSKLERGLKKGSLEGRLMISSGFGPIFAKNADCTVNQSAISGYKKLVQ